VVETNGFLLHLMAKLAHMLNDQSSQKFDNNQYKIMTKISWLTVTIDLNRDLSIKFLL